MRSLARFAAPLLAAALLLPGCAKRPPVPAPTGEDTAATAEAEVKPAPVDTLPTAVPPAVPPPPKVAVAVEPVVPEQATKQALEPKPAVNAAIKPPRSEPAAPAAESGQAARPAEAQAAATKTKRTDGPVVAVVGDSLAVGVGMTMEQRLAKAGGPGCLPMGKVSTGLISKKYDWEKALAETLASRPVSAVVVVLGGNDANNAIAGKGAGTPEWQEAYTAKVEHFLAIAAKAGVQVMWVGLPAMKDPAYGKRVAAVNAAARAGCAKTSGCRYLEPGDIFTDASGNYVQAKDIGGKTVSLRAGDGVHMTMTGYDLLCRRVLDVLGPVANPAKP
ncbi:MAG: hypothetical protein B193_3722 [Solidesulfovibrio magneticus str. Maddingley MBC34]|uniref:Uncharacterized protein n=1 Tax=Solidesulfovibrio magneticus str. Maddingley MBC34 TaxID=1206767 RepID=K6G934_9BACT|nr:MAG: hypothetical protein B193_3722 [Solidesulfovibrio magneticus str. Maddingley MBC34]